MNPSRSPADWTPDSPELTAFALKDGPFEQSVPGWAERRSEAEQAVSRSAPLRAEIGEIRRVADDIETRLAHEAVHRLSADRREAVLAYARNPGRGLPRRSSDSGGSASGSGWHRFWSFLTRPAMGFSLAAATALSIALALWSPWNRGSAPSRPGLAAMSARSKAPASSAVALESISTGAGMPPEVVEGSAVEVEAVEGVGSKALPDPVLAQRLALVPASAPEASPESPREELQRGEPNLQWDRSVGAGSESPGGTLGGPSSAAAAAKSKARGSAPPTSSSSSPALSARVLNEPEPGPESSLPMAKVRAKASASVPRREARSTRELPFQSVAEAPRSTFPLNPSKTSYSRVRQVLQEGRLPAPDAVRLEELVNYFSYEYPAPRGSDALAAHVEVADSPWSPEHRLVKIGLQARPNPAGGRPAAHIVVLVGLRPASSARLAWVQRSLRSLIETMDARDSLALLLDGPQGRMILPPTSAADRSALDRGLAALKAEGAPRGLEGLRRAYALAAQRRAPGAVQRVVWILDGEFSAEAGTREALASLIREQTEWGVLLKVLALNGDEEKAGSADAASLSSWMPSPGTAAYASVASPAEALSALRRESLSRPDPAGVGTVADDVQVEVQFNPERVDRWRLLGQETREATQPQADGPDGPQGRRGARIEAGHSVTALYEIVPSRSSARSAPASPQASESAALSKGSPAGATDLLSLEVGYRSPSREEPARTLRVGVPDVSRGVDAATADYKFAAAVVGYGLLLRDSPFKEDLTWEKVLALAEEGQGPDREGYRREFLQLVRRAAALNASAGGSAKNPAPQSPAATAPESAPLSSPPVGRPATRPQPERP